MLMTTGDDHVVLLGTRSPIQTYPMLEETDSSVRFRIKLESRV